MFWHVVATLPEDGIAKFVPDRGGSIKPKPCYDDLKQELLEGSKIPEKGRFTALTSSLVVGDQKPS